MKKFIQLLVVAIVGTTGNIYAQSGVYAGDALRFSRTDYGSSARFKGLGGAQISLGGDISSIGGNPAGLGMFTRSEFSVTPEFNNVNANASYLNQNTKTDKSRGNLNQAAAVWYNPIIRPKGSDLNKGVLSVVWGIGYNRNNDFGGDFTYSGRSNGNGSFARDLAQQSFGRSTSDMLNNSSIAGTAYDNYLIDAVAGTSPQRYAPATSEVNTQNNFESRVGSTSEFNFSGAINISNQWYIGASLGFVDVRYINNRTYNESGTIVTDPGTTSAEPNPQLGSNYNLTYQSSQNTSGSGVDGRIGVIYKPVDAIRIGATFQTPTWMHVEESFDESLNTRYTGGSNTNNPQNLFGEVVSNDVNYNLRTPYKGSLGASVILGKNALITADVDYVNYASMSFSGSDNTSRDLVSNNNQFIKDNYTGAFNYRVGGEYRIDKFSLRAGYGYNSTPYKVDPGNLSAIKTYSAGIGYRVSQYYVDLAYQRSNTNYGFSPYYLDNNSQPEASVDVARNNVFLTVGVRF